MIESGSDPSARTGQAAGRRAALALLVTVAATAGTILLLGPRAYDWAALRTNSPEPEEYARWLLIRRSVSEAPPR